jgi:uncharacterized tellurite resistance protein B-like protein
MAEHEVLDALTPFFGLTHAEAAERSLALRPDPDDYARFFLGRSAELAREVYDYVWDAHRFVLHAPNAASAEATAVTTRDLRAWSPAADAAFPRRWRRVAEHLVDGHEIWAFRLLDAEGQVVAQGEGLVMLFGHWRWFPSPELALDGVEPPERMPASLVPEPRSPLVHAAPTPVSPPTRPLPLAEVVLPAERRLRARLDANLDVQATELLFALPPVRSKERRGLMSKAMLLSRRVAPGLHRQIDDIRELLGIAHEVDVYSGYESLLNARIFRPHKGRVALKLSSRALQGLSSDELRYLIGHELAHVALDHTRLSAGMTKGSKLKGEILGTVYAWSRLSELTADRVGMLCAGSFEAAARAKFKSASGITDPEVVARAGDCTEHFERMQETWSESDSDDWYQSHPYSPVRIRAAQIFGESQMFFRLLGQEGGLWDDEELRLQTDELMRLMDPTYLRDLADGEVMRFLALSGTLMAMADGRVTEEELELLLDLINEEDRVEALDRVRASAEEAHAEMERRAKPLRGLPRLDRMRILEQLTLIAWANGDVHGSERALLMRVAGLLGLKAESVDDAIDRLTMPAEC